MSVRVPGSRLIHITATGVALAEVTPETVISVDLDGNVVKAGPGMRPSVETNMHLHFYRTRPSVRAVLHAHPPFATAFAASLEPFPLVTVQARLTLKFVPVLPPAMPGSRELASYVEQACKEHHDSRVFALSEHGVIAAAGSPAEAYYLIDLLEENAKTAFAARLLG